MNMLIICGLMVLYISIVLVVLIFVGVTLTNELKAKRLIEEKTLLLNMDINMGSYNIIEDMIQESLGRYSIINIDGKEITYIDSKIQDDITKYVLNDILTGISPVIYEKLCMLYNKDKIEDIIYFKINMAVLAYVIEMNGTYKE